MPKNYALAVTSANEQRRPKNALGDDWVKDFLHHAAIGHVATRWDDQPFITPTSFWYDEAQHAIIFHSNLVGRVRANSERHDLVCFEASEYGEFLPSNVALEFTVQYQSVLSGNSKVNEKCDNADGRRSLDCRCAIDTRMGIAR